MHAPRRLLLGSLVLTACGGPEATDERGAAASVTHPDLAWPNARIPYENRCAEPGIPYDPATNCAGPVALAIARWNDESPVVKFVPRTVERDYVVFRNGPGDCQTLAGSSPVGRQGGAQALAAPPCGAYEALPVILHEMGHAAGLHHELSRSDRDLFVRLDLANVAWASQPNFAFEGADVGFYARRSLMHYGSADTQAMAVDPDSWVLTDLDGGLVLPPAGHLTQGDLYGLAALYAPDAAPGSRDVLVSLTGHDRQLGGWWSRNVFAPARPSLDTFCAPGELCRTADVDGDGLDDLVRLQRGVDGLTGVYVARSDGTGFGPATLWASAFCGRGEECEIGDVNGDGADDLVAFRKRSLSQLLRFGAPAPYVSYALGGPGASAFQIQTQVTAYFCVTTDEDCLVGDVDADGRADLVSVERSTGEVRVRRQLTPGIFFGACESDGAICAEESYGQVALPADVRSASLRLADLDQDRRADLVVFDRGGTGDALVSFNTERTESYGFSLERPGFRALAVVAYGLCPLYAECEVAGVSSSPGPEIVVLGADGARVAESNWGWDVAAHWSPEVVSVSTWGGRCAGTEQCALGDVDGDGYADLVAFQVD